MLQAVLLTFSWVARKIVLHDYVCSTLNCAARAPNPKELRWSKTKEFDKQIDSKVNLTVKIDKDLLRKIRVVAAEEGTSISALVFQFHPGEVIQRLTATRKRESAPSLL